MSVGLLGKAVFLWQPSLSADCWETLRCKHRVNQRCGLTLPELVSTVGPIPIKIRDG